MQALTPYDVPCRWTGSGAPPSTRRLTCLHLLPCLSYVVAPPLALGVLLALGFLFAWAAPSFAQTGPLDTPQGGGLPAAVLGAADPDEVASAYGALSVFVLNVAAGNDGVTQQPDGEEAFAELFAQQFFNGYLALSAAEQQQYADLPRTVAQLQQVWPRLPLEQRLALRDQWAAAVQPVVANAPCELFIALVRAQLVPSYGAYKQPNVARVQQCWREHPELTQDAQERAAATGQAGGSTGSASTYTAMFNANMLSYTAGMNIASMGTATYKTR